MKPFQISESHLSLSEVSWQINTADSSIRSKLNSCDVSFETQSASKYFISKHLLSPYPCTIPVPKTSKVWYLQLLLPRKVSTKTKSHGRYERQARPTRGTFQQRVHAAVTESPLAFQGNPWTILVRTLPGMPCEICVIMFLFLINSYTDSMRTMTTTSWNHLSRLIKAEKVTDTTTRTGWILTFDVLNSGKRYESKCKAWGYPWDFAVAVSCGRLGTGRLYTGGKGEGSIKGWRGLYTVVKTSTQQAAVVGKMLLKGINNKPLRHSRNFKTS